MSEQFRLLIWKDVRALWRRRELLVASFGFALLLTVVASFAFRLVGYGQRELLELTPGILWLIFLFSGVTTLGQSFLVEEEHGALAGVLLSGVDPGLVYFSKFLSNTAFLTLLQGFVIVLHGVLFGVEYFHLFTELLALGVFASIGFVSLGTLLAAIAAATSGRELLLPLTLFPLCLPLLAGAVLATRTLLLEGALPIGDFWFVLMLVFDVVSLVLSLVLFEYVVKE